MRGETIMTSNHLKRVQQMIQAISQKGSSPGGLRVLVGMLRQVDRETERYILKEISLKNPDLARQLNEAYFTFEDILTLEDRAIQQALSEVDRKTLAMALKGVPEAILGKVTNNLSPRAAQLLLDEIEYLGPQPRSKVEDAQRQVTEALQRWRNAIL